MLIELTPDAEVWVKAEVAFGTYPTAEDAVREAINFTKLHRLRAELAAAEAEGGSLTPGEARQHFRDYLDRQPKAPPSES